MSLGSKQSGSTTTTQTADPWAGVQPYLSSLFRRADNLSAQNPGLAPQSSATTQAQVLQAQRALSGSPLTSAAQQGILGTIQGDNLNPYTSGAVGDVMDMTKSKINSQFSGDNFGNSA